MEVNPITVHVENAKNNILSFHMEKKWKMAANMVCVRDCFT